MNKRSLAAVVVTATAVLALGAGPAVADRGDPDPCDLPDPLSAAQCTNARLQAENDGLRTTISQQNTAMTALRLDYDRIKPSADALPAAQVEAVLLRNEVAETHTALNMADLKISELRRTVKHLRAVIRDLRSR